MESYHQLIEGALVRSLQRKQQQYDTRPRGFRRFVGSSNETLDNFVRPYLEECARNAGLFTFMASNMMTEQSYLDYLKNIKAAQAALEAYDRGEFRISYGYAKTRRAQLSQMLQRPKYSHESYKQFGEDIVRTVEELLRVRRVLRLLDAEL